MVRKIRLVPIATLALGLALTASAVLAVGYSAAAPEDDVKATVQAAVSAWNGGDAETFVSYFTEEGLASLVDYEPTVESVQADIDETGPIASVEVSDVRVDGSAATAIVDLQFEAGFALYERWTFEETDEGWVISASESAARPIPAGVPAVEMTLQEYAFVYNKDAVNAADGNFAFSVTNAGQEEHEIVIVRIDSDKPLLQLLEESDPESEEPPEGVEFITFGGFFDQGAVGTTLLPDPLSPGNYALLCFVEAPDGTPHAFLGMISEFTISGGGPVGGMTPPNTGDGGLLSRSGTGVEAWSLLGLALVVVLGYARRWMSIGV